MRTATPGVRLSLSFVVVSTLLVVGVAAVPANDWSKPCFNGECAYELPKHSNSGLGVLKIAGSPKSITDITPAAGWIVLDCDPHSLEQEIRLVCQSEDDTACNHVFDHWGPEDKIVRLPESCGSGPFARIAAASLASNQDLPPHAVGKVVRRSGMQPVIHSFKIDTNFALVDVDKVGPVNFAFVGLTAPSPSEAFAHPDIDLNFAFVDGFPGDLLNAVGSTIGSWVSNTTKVVTHAVTDAANTVAHATETAGKAVAHAAEDAGKAVAHAAEDAGKAVAHAAGSAFQAVTSVPGLLENATHFKLEPQVETAPVKFDGKANLIDYKPQGCSGGGGTTGGVIAGELKVDVAGTGKGDVRAGVLIDGSIVPPKIKDFGAFAGLSFDIDAEVTIKAAVFGGYESPRVSIVKPVGLPGFSIPGIITIGPMFELQGHAKAALDMKIDSVVHLAYKVDDLELWYPASIKNATEKGIDNKESPLKLKANAKASAQGYIEGHLVPIIKFGFEVLGGAAAGASVYLEADAFARVSVEVEAHASANIGTAPAAPAHPKKGKRDTYRPPYSRRARSELALRDTDTAVHEGAKGGFSGCVWLEAGLELNFGADANLGAIWSVKGAGSLWKSPIWSIWSGCFAAGTKAAKEPPKSMPNASALQAKFKEHKLTCDADAGELEAIPDERLPAKKLLK